MPAYVERTPESMRARTETDANGCWVWRGRITAGGYGHLRSLGRTYRAHRLMYELTHGPIPGDLPIDHLCRNRACINPGHLEVVTTTVNNRRSSGTKLTEQRVRDIRRLWSTGGISLPKIGAQFGVVGSTIWSVVRGKNWRDVA